MTAHETRGPGESRSTHKNRSRGKAFLYRLSILFNNLGMHVNCTEKTIWGEDSKELEKS